MVFRGASKIVLSTISNEMGCEESSPSSISSGLAPADVISKQKRLKSGRHKTAIRYLVKAFTDL